MIGVGFARADPFHGSFEPHLAFQFRPEKHHRGPWVAFEIATFAAFVIGKENQPIRVELPQQYHTGRWHTIRRSGRQSHGVWFGKLLL